MKTEGKEENGMIDEFYLANLLILYVFNIEQLQTDTEKYPQSGIIPNAPKRPFWWMPV